MNPVDPIHFFNARGLSILSEDHLAHRVAELEKENAELRRRVRSLALRLRASAEEPAAFNS